MFHLNIIAHIESLTKERGWSQYRLAKEANLPQTTIANIFNRGTTPSIATLEMLCKAFNITLSEFFLEEATGDAILTAEQKRLLTYWNTLTLKQQQLITELLKHMNDNTNQELTS